MNEEIKIKLIISAILFKNNVPIKEAKQIGSYIEELEQENKQLKQQIEYIRSGEYYNQLRFERDMLQDIVDNGEVSKEDREFIDCTHRNTELLEENQQLKSQLEQRDNIINKAKEFVYDYKKQWTLNDDVVDDMEVLLKILDNKGE